MKNSTKLMVLSKMLFTDKGKTANLGFAVFSLI